MQGYSPAPKCRKTAPPMFCPAVWRFTPTWSGCSRTSACSRLARRRPRAPSTCARWARAVVTVEGDASRIDERFDVVVVPEADGVTSAVVAGWRRLLVDARAAGRRRGQPRSRQQRRRRLLRPSRRAGAALPARADAGLDPVSGHGRGRVRRRAGRAAHRVAAGQGRARAARRLRRGRRRRRGRGPRLPAGAAAVRAASRPGWRARRPRRRRRRC